MKLLNFLWRTLGISSIQVIFDNDSHEIISKEGWRLLDDYCILIDAEFIKSKGVYVGIKKEITNKGVRILYNGGCHGEYYQTKEQAKQRAINY